MGEVPQFGFFDRERPTEFRKHNLPHWFQSGVAMFVTFRLLDSLPVEVVLKMRQDFLAWIKSMQLSETLVEGFFKAKSPAFEAAMEALPPSVRKRVVKRFGQLFNLQLDQCHGACPLRDPVVAKMMAGHILHFDGKRYDLDCFVVMPNHIHAILQFRAGHVLKGLSQSWLRLSARRINAHLKQTGALWRPEPFDHLIRSAKQFESLRVYIQKNPEMAGLKDGEFLYYSR